MIRAALTERHKYCCKPYGSYSPNCHVYIPVSCEGETRFWASSLGWNVRLQHDSHYHLWLTCPRNCSCSCCHLWIPGWLGGSSSFSSPRPIRFPCFSELCSLTFCHLLLRKYNSMVSSINIYHWERNLGKNNNDKSISNRANCINYPNVWLGFFNVVIKSL